MDFVLDEDIMIQSLVLSSRDPDIQFLISLRGTGIHRVTPILKLHVRLICKTESQLFGFLPIRTMPFLVCRLLVQSIVVSGASSAHNAALRRGSSRPWVSLRSRLCSTTDFSPPSSRPNTHIYFLLFSFPFTPSFFFFPSCLDP